MTHVPDPVPQISEVWYLFAADDPFNSKVLLVLEYVEGGPLFDGPRLSPSRKLTEVYAHKYFRDILQVPPPLPTPMPCT
jgi:serine/threonine protein kinase